MLPDPNDPNDVLPRLERAADVIMRRRGSAKERLASAYTDHLVSLRPDEFPVEHQPALEELTQAMLRVTDAQKGSAVASIAAMDDAEVSRWSEIILRIYNEMSGRRPGRKS